MTSPTPSPAPPRGYQAFLILTALVCGAHPYKIVQSHWHASSTEKLMEKLGIDWQAKKAEFEAYLKEVAAGKFETLYDPRRAITSGPGYKRITATP